MLPTVTPSIVRTRMDQRGLMWVSNYIIYQRTKKTCRLGENKVEFSNGARGT